jgi:UDPglucose 6-dehydrogenase
MVIVDKSTVPVGTAEKVKSVIADELKRREADIHFSVVSNPEFLREGVAIDDFMKPDRVVIGCDDDEAAKIMTKLYQPFVRNFNPIIIMDIKSAELTKYAANAMLALRISYMNEIANLCEKLGANVDMVRKGIGTDHRIGKHFLYSGIGYGGSCFPKDVKAIVKTADEHAYDFKILKAVEDVNAIQKELLYNKINLFYKSKLKGKSAAFWGLSFKPNTDDMREAPSIVIINKLLESGVSVNVYDPEAMREAKHIFADKIKYANHYYDSLENADFLIIATEWNDFRNPDFSVIASKLKDKVIFDGRNLYNLEDMLLHNLKYFSIGRKNNTND